MEKRACLRCKGTGSDHLLFGGGDGKCRSCDGSGFFAPLDEIHIRASILASKGKNKGRIRASMISGRGNAREYYCWRLARFHGGKDPCMPVMADLFVRHDPFKPELDKLAEAIAREQFGSDMRAAHMWARAFGMV